MKVLVTGSSGHLGEALVRTLRAGGDEVIGLDILPSPFTSHIGSITDRNQVAQTMEGIEGVFHAATLHKPHVATHRSQVFVDTNITGTLNLLEESISKRVKFFIFTSTTSVFGDALIPPPGEPALWVTEELNPVSKNIYGVTKLAAENLCQLFHRNYGLACMVLRTSRFFPEEDDDPIVRAAYADANIKANEFLLRRVEIEDAVSAHLLAASRAREIGFGTYIVSATTLFSPDHLAELRVNAPAVVKRLLPAYEKEFAIRGWKMFPSIDRVYSNELAREELGWKPNNDFSRVIERLSISSDWRSELAKEIGSKGYHDERFSK
ncbi:MAG: NAD-dependent epimerase/dehydratase family protein, partial [Chitinophagales bacterium]